MSEDPTSELVDQAKDTHEEAEHGEFGKKGHANHKVRCVIVLSFLAVLTAIGSCLSGHAEHEANQKLAQANLSLAQANLREGQATDQWAYFQAKGTKENMKEASADILAVLGPAVSADPAKLQATIDALHKDAAKYGQQKDEIQKQALALEAQVKTLTDEVQSLTAEANQASELHEWLALAAVCFTIGTVASMASLAVAAGWLLWSAVTLGVLGILIGAYGYASSAGSEEHAHEAHAPAAISAPAEHH